MSPVPKSFIHINFMPGELFFDARPIWKALNDAVAAGTIRATDSRSIQEALGNSAIHIATRFLVLRFAVSELRAASEALYSYAPRALPVESIPNTFALNEIGVEMQRDQCLLAVDSFLFEFRAFLELIAKFVYVFLSGLGKTPGKLAKLSTGETLPLVNKKGDVQTHNLIRFLCDALNVRADWFAFLAIQRNFFTHSATPYCAIEREDGEVPRYDLLIMKTNIRDFAHANPEDYFRVSDCAAVVGGVREFALAVQNYLITQLR